jgi:hypothetical protein
MAVTYVNVPYTTEEGQERLAAVPTIRQRVGDENLTQIMFGVLIAMSDIIALMRRDMIAMNENNTEIHKELSILRDKIIALEDIGPNA